MFQREKALYLVKLLLNQQMAHNNASSQVIVVITSQDERTYPHTIQKQLAFWVLSAAVLEGQIFYRFLLSFPIDKVLDYKAKFLKRFLFPKLLSIY